MMEDGELLARYRTSANNTLKWRSDGSLRYATMEEYKRRALGLNRFDYVSKMREEAVRRAT